MLTGTSDKETRVYSCDNVGGRLARVLTGTREAAPCEDAPHGPGAFAHAWALHCTPYRPEPHSIDTIFSRWGSVPFSLTQSQPCSVSFRLTTRSRALAPSGLRCVPTCSLENDNVSHLRTLFICVSGSCYGSAVSVLCPS